MLAEHLANEAIWGQAVAVLAAVISAVYGYLNRRSGRVPNGDGRKGPSAPILISKLDKLDQKVDDLGSRLDKHVSRKSLFGRHG